MQQLNFKHCWIDSASACYKQEYMIYFIISQKSVMPEGPFGGISFHRLHRLPPPFDY